MQHTLPILLEYISSQDWAMNLPVLEQMAEIVERHCRGERVSDEYIKAVTARKEEKESDRKEFEFIAAGGTAVIPISGIIAKYSRMVNDVSLPRGTSVEQVISQLEQARGEPKVKSIFLHIESPGGNVDGVADLAQRIYEISFEKPVTAFADDTAASAAYWLGSQANVFYANQTADVGSIGVYTLYVDSSKMAEKEGLKFYIFRSGPQKGVGSPGIKITKENRDEIQLRIESKFEIFLTAVLRGRVNAGLDEKNLRELADGRTFVGAEAVENKLVDGIMTLEEALSAGPPTARDQTNVTAATSAKKHNNSQIKESVMSETKEKDDAAAVEEQKRQDVTAVERQRISAINSVLAAEGLADVRKKAIAEGMNITEAKAAAFETAIKAAKENETALQDKLDVANEKLSAIATAGSEVTAAETVDEKEEPAGGTGDDNGQAETYTKAVEEYQKSGLGKADSFIKAARQLPKSHAAWKKAKEEAR